MELRVVRSVAAAAAFALTASVCGFAGSAAADQSPSSGPTLSPTQAPDASKLTQYLTQKLAWTPCPGHDGFECASATVPVNYADPSGATMAIAMDRHSATGPGTRLGSLLVNPGGPGESGLGMVFDGAANYKTLNQRYDLVGFDPRGVGQSEGIVCLDDAQKDAYYQSDFDPTTTADRLALIKAVEGYAAACQRNSGKILAYVGTENVARDMDVMRAALGDSKLNYFGVSYGTRLGQVYAGQYPTSVGRMVLDSIDNPGEAEQQEETGPGTSSVESSEEQLGRVFQLCATQEGTKCPTGTDPAAAAKRYDALLAKLAQNPLPAGNRKLTASLARYAAFQATYDPLQLGPHLVDGIVEAERGGTGELLGLADMYIGREPDGHYANKSDAFLAIKSLEGDPNQPRPDTSKAEQGLAEAAADAAKTSPHFGALLTYANAVGGFWPVNSTYKPTAIKAAGSPTILLVNDTRDNATPLSDAEAVSKQLANNVLVTNDADGHGAYGRGACITKVVDDFLGDGTVPAKGTACKETVGAQ